MERKMTWTEEKIKDKLAYFFPDIKEPKENQLYYIKAILEGKDILAVMPTGSGKSLCYQFSGLIIPGVTVVIQPIVALVHDQAKKLQEKNIPAICIDNIEKEEETKDVKFAVSRNKAYRECSEGKYKFIFVTPERFRSPHFINLLNHMEVNLIVFDEAHCLSLWGHDFRKSYLDAIRVLRMLRGRKKEGRLQVAAFTATATTDVKIDIIKLLSESKAKKEIETLIKNSKDNEDIIARFCSQVILKDLNFVVRAGEEDPINSNLYFVHHILDSKDVDRQNERFNNRRDFEYVRQWDYKRETVLKIIDDEIRRYKPAKWNKYKDLYSDWNKEVRYLESEDSSDNEEGRKKEKFEKWLKNNDRYPKNYPCGIIFCETIAGVDKVAKELTHEFQGKNIRIAKYYGPMDKHTKHENSEKFVSSKAIIMVATNAYGMGIDKNDIRFIIHYNIPRCIENYVQECGRAGRNKSFKGYCHLIYSEREVKYPPVEEYTAEGGIKGTSYIHDYIKFKRMCDNALITGDKNIHDDLKRYFMDPPRTNSTSMMIEYAMQERELSFPPVLYSNSCLAAGRIRKGQFNKLSGSLKISGSINKTEHRPAGEVIDDLASSQGLSITDLAEKLNLSIKAIKMYYGEGRYHNNTNYPKLEARIKKTFTIPRNFFNTNAQISSDETSSDEGALLSSTVTDIDLKTNEDNTDDGENYITVDLFYNGLPYSEVKEEDRLSYFDMMVMDAVYTLEMYDMPISVQNIYKLLSGDLDISVYISKAHAHTRHSDKVKIVKDSFRKMINTGISINFAFSHAQGIYYGKNNRPDSFSGVFLPIEMDPYSNHAFRPKQSTIDVFVPIGCKKNEITGKFQTVVTKVSKKVICRPPLCELADMLLQYHTFPLDVLNLKGKDWNYKKIWNWGENVPKEYRNIVDSGITGYENALADECDKYKISKQIIEYYRKKLQIRSSTEQNFVEDSFPQHSIENMILAHFLLNRIAILPTKYRYYKNRRSISPYIQFYPKDNASKCILEYLFRGIGEYSEHSCGMSYKDKENDPYFLRKWQTILCEKYPLYKELGKAFLDPRYSYKNIDKKLRRKSRESYEEWKKRADRYDEKFGTQDPRFYDESPDNPLGHLPGEEYKEWKIRVNKDYKIKKKANEKDGTLSIIMKKIAECIPLQYQFINNQMLYIEKKPSKHLKKCYPIMFVNTIKVAVRGDNIGDTGIRVINMILGYDVYGTKEIIGVWNGKEGNISGEEYWKGIFNNIRSRGVESVLFVLSPAYPHNNPYDINKLRKAVKAVFGGKTGVDEDNSHENNKADISVKRIADIASLKKDFDWLVNRTLYYIKEEYSDEFTKRATSLSCSGLFKKLTGIDISMEIKKTLDNNNDILKFGHDMNRTLLEFQKKFSNEKDHQKIEEYKKCKEEVVRYIDEVSITSNKIKDYSRKMFLAVNAEKVYQNFINSLSNYPENLKEKVSGIWHEKWGMIYSGLLKKEGAIRQFTEFVDFSQIIEKRRFPSTESAKYALMTRSETMNESWQDAASKQNHNPYPETWEDIINDETLDYTWRHLLNNLNNADTGLNLSKGELKQAQDVILRYYITTKKM